MAEFTRYAIYDAPRPGAFADRVAHWLGWDATTGQHVETKGPAHLPAPQMHLIRGPRKYGFHGTLKPPFRLGEGVTRAQLSGRVAQLAQNLRGVGAEGLQLHDLGGWLALMPKGDQSAISELAGQVVRQLDDLRAPLSEAEILRRDPARLTPRQRHLLLEWGYPHVLDQFRFHLTLTDMLPGDQAAALVGPLAEWLAPVLPQPFHIHDLCLFGEAPGGCFHLLERHPLAL